MEHEFTAQILQTLYDFFEEDSRVIFEHSSLLQYLNIKTRSASSGSKSRGSFANIYALYVLIDDYLDNQFDKSGNYHEYEGARYSDLLAKQRQLPFGKKLQNHALNSRMNEEFKKYFPHIDIIPILRDIQTNRYWINENLLNMMIQNQNFNIAKATITIIERYIETKQSSFKTFIKTCEELRTVSKKDDGMVSEFIKNLLSPKSDARIFEIVSYAILRYYYYDQTVYFGFSRNDIQKQPLQLFKTGRTNANDGGIDFVMRPLGRFFQVTENSDVKKYLLDIDKIEHFPISFVIKSNETVQHLLSKLEKGAKGQYGINRVVERYMNCIEEVINIPQLIERFENARSHGHLRKILDEIVLQSKLEFNFDELESELFQSS